MIKLFRKKNVPKDVGEKSEAQPAEPLVITGSAEVQLERMKVEISTLLETRKVIQDRMAAMSEQIGELRSMIVSKEREIREVKVLAEKASDLVNEVQPEKLKIDMQKEDTKLESLRGLISANEGRLGDLSKELKELRKAVEVFRGSEKIAEMNEDMQKELREMQKMKAVINAHSDKVESMFMDVQKNFNEFQQFKEIAKELEKSFKDITESMRVLKSKTAKFAERSELKEIEKKTDEKLAEIGTLASRSEDYLKFFSKVDIQKRLYSMEEEMTAMSRNIVSTEKYFEELTETIAELKSLAKLQEKEIIYNKQKIERLLDIIEFIAEKISK